MSIVSKRLAAWRQRQNRHQRPSCPIGLETLEPRLLMTTAPVFLNNILNQFIPANGNALTLGIDGFDAEGDTITISAVSDDPRLSVLVPQNNRFARLTFTESDGTTPIGDIIIELFEDRVPENVERFIALATTGFDEEGGVDPDADPFYTDVLVHRVVPNFVIQTGDATNGNGTGDSPLPDFAGKIDAKILSFANAGVVAWANAGAGTNNSQFFITAAETDHLNTLHPILGHMVSGQDIFDEIINRPRGANDRPTDPPLLKSVEIFESTDDGTVTLKAATAPGTETTLYTSTSNTAPQPPNWIFAANPGPQPTSTFNGSYVLDTTANLSIMAGQGNNPTSRPLTFNTVTGYDLSFNLRIVEENHTSTDRAGFSFIAIGDDPTKSLEVAFWEDRVWVYNFDEETDFTHGAEFMVDTTTFHNYTLRVENNQYALLVDGEEAITGALEDYTGIERDEEFINPYVEPNTLFFGDDTSRGSARVEVKSVVFRDGPAGVENGDFDGNAIVTLTLDDGHGHVTNKQIEVSTTDLGSRPVIGTVANQKLNRGETKSFDVTITDDQNLPLDVTITTEQDGVLATIVPKAGVANTYTVTITVPDEALVFDATISAVEAGFGDFQGITPSTRTFSVTTVGDAPTITGLPTTLNLVPGQTNIFNITITDDQNAELDVDISTEQEGVEVSIESLGVSNLYQVRVELPNEHFHFDVEVNVSEAVLDRNPDNARTSRTFAVSTIGNRPTIADPGEQRVAQGGTVTFTADIDDDTNAPLTVTATTTETGVTASIDPVTHEVTVVLPPDVHKFFQVTLSAIETAGDELMPTKRTFTVSTLGDRPVIADTGTVTMDVGEVSNFTPTITDDTGIPLTLSVTSSTPDVTVTIDQETKQVTLVPADDNYRVFTVTVRAVETGFTGLATTSRNFTVVTGLGVASTDATADSLAVFATTSRLFVANGTAGIMMFDITNPVAPVLLGSFDNGIDARDVRFIGDTLYVADFLGAVVALDVSNPANIVQLDRFVTNGQGKALMHDPANPDILYVAAGSTGVVVLDITDPDNLIRVTTIKQVNRSTSINNAAALALQDDILYVGDMNGGVKILDVEDPAEFDYHTTLNPNGSIPDVAVKDDLLLVVNTKNNRLIAYDVRRPTRPKRLSAVDFDSPPIRVEIIGDTAIVSQPTGSSFVDVTFPEFMVFDRDFKAASRGMDPFVFGERIFIPVRDSGQVVILEDDVLGQRVTLQKRQTIIDDNGVEVTVNVRGPGTVVLRTSAEGGGHIESMEIFGTAPNSSVIITTRGGDAVIDEIFVGSFLKSLIGKTTDLVGNLSVNSQVFVGSIWLDDVTGATLALGSFPAEIDLTFDQVTDTSITGAKPIDHLRVGNWLDNDAAADGITAAQIDRLDVDMNFQAGLTLSGIFQSRRTLNSAKIGMDLTGAIWNITGDIGTLSNEGEVDDFELNANSNVSKLDFGDVVEADIDVEDMISSLTAKRWQDGVIAADELRRLRVTGDRRANLPGNFSAGVTLRELGSADIKGDVTGSTFTLTQEPGTGNRPPTALDSLKVAGAILDTVIRSASRIERITAGAIRNSTIFAGVRNDLSTLPTVAGDFPAMVRIDRVETKGLPDATADFVNTHIAAWELEDIILRGVQNDNGGTEFGLAAHAIDDLGQPDLAPGGDPLGGPGANNDSVVRII